MYSYKYHTTRKLPTYLLLWGSTETDQGRIVQDLLRKTVRSLYFDGFSAQSNKEARAAMGGVVALIGQYNSHRRARPLCFTVNNSKRPNIDGTLYFVYTDSTFCHVFACSSFSFSLPRRY